MSVSISRVSLSVYIFAKVSLSLRPVAKFFFTLSDSNSFYWWYIFINCRKSIRFKMKTPYKEIMEKKQSQKSIFYYENHLRALVIILSILLFSLQKKLIKTLLSFVYVCIEVCVCSLILFIFLLLGRNRRTRFELKMSVLKRNHDYDEKKSVCDLWL